LRGLPIASHSSAAAIMLAPCAARMVDAGVSFWRCQFFRKPIGQQFPAQFPRNLETLDHVSLLQFGQRTALAWINRLFQARQGAEKIDQTEQGTRRRLVIHSR